MKVTFPHLGSMHIFCKAIAETAGIPYIVPPETSRKTLVDHQVVAFWGDLCERYGQTL
jgi:hypothetical protein